VIARRLRTGCVWLCLVSLCLFQPTDVFAKESIKKPTSELAPKPTRKPVRDLPQEAAKSDAGDDSAAEPKGMFDGHEFTPTPKTLLTIKDANVRAGPATKEKRLTVVHEGVRVEAVGRVKGTEWFGIRQGGEDLGFVYQSVVVPIVDGALAEDLKGALRAAGQPRCTYRVRYDGKSTIPGEIQNTADYTIFFQCRTVGRRLDFQASMFLTELPYYDMAKAEYQINVDVLGVADGDEDVLSATVIYHPLKDRVEFSRLNIKTMGSGNEAGTQPAHSIDEALNQAVTMAYNAWGRHMWEALLKR